MTNANLTIVLPLRDRAQFTARCIESAKHCGRIIVADGSTERQGVDPCVHYLYTKPDITLADWWFKMCLAFDCVVTDYAMVIDNDDILVPAGITRCLDFLERHPDYIAYSGRIQGFWAWPDQVVGPYFAKRRQYAPFDLPADYWQPTANDRVLAGFQNSWSYYAVYRTEALRLIWNEVRDLDLTNLQVHEKFCAMRALSLGKIKCDGSYASYLRQIGTSSTAVHNQDFAHNLFRTQFNRDVSRVLDRMEFQGVNRSVLAERWAQWFDGYLRRTYGPWPRLRQAAKRRLPRLAWMVQNRHRWGLA